MNDKMQSPKAQAIYRAVLTLAEQGVDLRNVRVQQIADAANMGKGTLYEYFASKEDILQGTLAYCINQELARLTQMLATAQDFAAITEAAMDYIEDLVSHRFAIYEMVVRVEQHSAPVPALGTPQYPDILLTEGLENLLERAYQSALQAGMDKNTSLSYFNFCVVSAQAGFAVGLRREDAAQAPILRKNAKLLLMRGLGIAQEI